MYGNDEYAMSRRAAEIAGMFRDQSEADMNTARLDATTMTDEEWTNAVNALPFLASQRLVLLAHPSRRYSDAKSRPRFLAMLEKVPPTTRLVMWDDVDPKALRSRGKGKTGDGGTWLTGWLTKHGQAVERHDLPAPGSMPGWIVRQFKEQGGDIATGAAARLADMVGTDTRQASQEIAKLLAYVNWSRPVTAADVDAVSVSTAEPNIFAMLDALAGGNTGTAQRLLHHLMESEDQFGTWAMIQRQFRLMLLAREVLDARGGQSEMIKAMRAIGMNASSFVADKALKQARGFKMQRLEAIYHQLLEIDEAAKTGRMPLDVGLDMLIAELAS
ncbi:MAG: DNA polymerase III subunit delta [Anaerolineales bacterium]